MHADLQESEDDEDEVNLCLFLRYAQLNLSRTKMAASKETRDFLYAHAC